MALFSETYRNNVFKYLSTQINKLWKFLLFNLTIQSDYSSKYFSLEILQPWIKKWTSISNRILTIITKTLLGNSMYNDSFLWNLRFTYWVKFLK